MNTSSELYFGHRLTDPLETGANLSAELDFQIELLDRYEDQRARYQIVFS